MSNFTRTSLHKEAITFSVWLEPGADVGIIGIEAGSPRFSSSLHATVEELRAIVGCINDALDKAGGEK